MQTHTESIVLPCRHFHYLQLHCSLSDDMKQKPQAATYINETYTTSIEY